MSSIASVLRQRVLDAVLCDPVAAQAGMSLVNWADPAAPHVFDGDTVPAGLRNRGQLPFIEIFVDVQPFTGEGNDIGMAQTTVILRANVGGYDARVAVETAEALLGAAVHAIRADDYFSNLSDTRFDAAKPGPCWLTCDATLLVQNTYDPADYGVT